MPRRMEPRPILTRVPLVLITDFGYDPGHSIVKARQAGLPADAVLYKPFRFDQPLKTVEHVIHKHQSLRRLRLAR